MVFLYFFNKSVYSDPALRPTNIDFPLFFQWNIYLKNKGKSIFFGLEVWSEFKFVLNN